MKLNKRDFRRRIESLLERNPGELAGYYDVDAAPGIRAAFRDVLERQDKILRLLKDAFELTQ
ncbi:MAG: hypothetical protein GY778_06275 [bacterium]|nr:hypothetical protein [bacterium]